MSLARTPNPAGTPCTRVTSAGPCDSPAVEKPNLTALKHVLSRYTFEQATLSPSYAPANINHPTGSVIPLPYTQGDGKSPPLLKRSSLRSCWLPLKSKAPGDDWSLKFLFSLVAPSLGSPRPLNL